MPPSEALSRSQLAQQAQPPPPHSQASEHKDQPSASASPRDHMESGLAALQQGSYSAMSNDTPSEDADARNKSKRELSTSKRAAQNRAAQVSSFLYFTVDYCVVYVLTFEKRAFRQRKERYITELEEKVKQFETMETDFRSLQDENHQLREYILSLQSQLLEQTREPSSAPSSPPRRRRDAEQAPDHVLPDRIAPPSLPPSVAAQSETTKSGSWSEHIDNLRQRYSEYPAHRSSIGGSASYTPEEKRMAKD